MKRLVLFDIDGTLIKDSGASRTAYKTALQRAYGFDGDVTRYDFSGKTDPEITYMVMGDAGLSTEEIERGFETLWTTYIGELSRRASRDTIQLLDGVTDLLEQLARRDDVVLALLTGNIEPGARLKLAPHALNDYFPFGAFGSDDHRRVELPPIAIERARAALGCDISGRDVVVVGDSIYDVRCGVPHQATTIAVATGKTAAETLRAERPDYLFESLAPTPELIAAICGF